VTIDGQGGISEPTLQCVFKEAPYILIRAKLKVSIGVIIASLTERRALLQWFKLEISKS